MPMLTVAHHVTRHVTATTASPQLLLLKCQALGEVELGIVAGPPPHGYLVLLVASREGLYKLQQAANGTQQ